MIIGTHAYNALLWVKHHEMLSATERNLIGRRTESDRTADGIRSDGERERWHTSGVHLSQVHHKTNKAVKDGLKAQQSHSPGQRPG